MERNCVKMILFVHVVDRYSLSVYSVTVEEEDYYDITIPSMPLQKNLWGLILMMMILKKYGHPNFGLGV